jgi:hypothetical protein
MARGIPAAGHRCDPSKLLLDPYGKSFHGDFDFTKALFSDDLEAASENGGADPSSSTPPMVDSLGHTIARFARPGAVPLGVVRSGSLAVIRPRALRVVRPGTVSAGCLLDKVA